jgi:diadenosine tetraphosphate (Ap4A) HIT family hydrolase
VSSLGQWAFKIALNPQVGALVGYGFEYATPLLPVKKVDMTPKTIAFIHPRPAWNTHILSKKIRNIFKLCQHPEHFQDVLLTASKQIQQHFKRDAYTLLVNGGIRQDVLQVHFHLNGEKAFAPAVLELPKEAQRISGPRDFDLYLLQNDTHFHAVYIRKKAIPPLSQWGNATSMSFDLGLEILDQTYSLTKRGFSLVFQEASPFEQSQLVIHLVAGGKLAVAIE